jgi:hypothetical protein
MARERCRDLIGKKVLLLRDIRTMGGHFFEKGRTMIVSSTYRGRYGLRALGTDANQTNVKNVSKGSFEVIGR